MAERDPIQASQISLIVSKIKTLLDSARSNAARQVNKEILSTYWNIGRIICNYEQSDPNRADYGKQTLKELSRELTKEFGRAFPERISTTCASFI